MIDIFIKLPIKSILRSRSVCKSWYFLLTSPNFISTHLNQNQNMNHIIMQYRSINSEKEKYVLFCDNENMDQYAQFDLPFERYIKLWVVVMEFCVSRTLTHVIQIISIFGTHPFENHRVGFGFDCVTNDYKVVIVHTDSRLMPFVELYKLSTGVWKDISHHVALSYQFFCSTPPVYLNGASHWIAFKGKELEEPNRSMIVIVLFDMHDETFLEMMLPSSLTNEVRLECDEMFLLFVSEESLCLVDNNYDLCEPITEIWMMREYGAADSWVKKFSIRSRYFTRNYIPLRDEYFLTAYYNERSALYEIVVTHELVRPMTIRKNGEIIWKANRTVLVSVDHVVGKFKDVGLGNSTNGWCYNPRYVDYYKESLVLPDKWTNYCVGDAYEESFTCQK